METDFNIWPYRIWGTCLVCVGIICVAVGIFVQWRLCQFLEFDNIGFDEAISKKLDKLELDELPEFQQNNITRLVASNEITHRVSTQLTGAYQGIIYHILFSLIITGFGVSLLFLGRIKRLEYMIRHYAGESLNARQSSRALTIAKKTGAILLFLYCAISIVACYFEVSGGVKSLKDVGFVMGALIFTCVVVAQIVSFVVNKLRS